MSLGLTDRREKSYNLGLVGLFLGLVVFVHGVQQATKIVLCLGDVKQVGQRHGKDGKAGCPIVEFQQTRSTLYQLSDRFFIARLLNTLSSSWRDIIIV